MMVSSMDWVLVYRLDFPDRFNKDNISKEYIYIYISVNFAINIAHKAVRDSQWVWSSAASSV